MRVGPVTQNFGASDQDFTIQLPRPAMLVRQVVVEITFAVNFAAGVTLFASALARALTLSLFTVDSADPQLGARGDVWKNFQAYLENAVSDYTEFGAGAGAQTGTWRFVVPLSDPRTPDPDTTALDWALCANPALRVQWAGATALTATAGAHTTTSGTVKVWLEGDQRPSGSPAVQRRFYRKWLQYAFLSPTAIPASSKDQPYRLNTGQIVRREMIQTRETSSATKAFNSSLLEAVEWQVGGVKQGKIEFDALRALAMHERRIVPPTGTVLDDGDPQDALLLSELDDFAGIAELLWNFDTNALPDGLEVVVFEESIQAPRV